MKKDMKGTKFKGAIVSKPLNLEIDLSKECLIDLDFYSVYPIAHLDYKNDTWFGHDLSNNKDYLNHKELLKKHNMLD